MENNDSISTTAIAFVVFIAIKTTKAIAVVEMESLFSTSMSPLLETLSKIQSTDHNERTKIAYEVINVM